MIKITFPDQKVREYPEGTTAMEIAKSISEGLARNVLAAKINGEVWDATRPINADAQLHAMPDHEPRQRPHDLRHRGRGQPRIGRAHTGPGGWRVGLWRREVSSGAGAHRSGVFRHLHMGLGNICSRLDTL